MKTYTTKKDGQEIVKASYLAKHYKVTEPTIYSWAKRGKLPCIRFQNTIRFNFEAVKAAIEGELASHPSEAQIEALRRHYYEEQAAMADEREVVA